MKLFIPATTVARIMRWSTSDFRATRRTLKAPLVTVRGTRTGRGKTPDLLELSALLKWLDKVLTDGLDADLADQLAAESEPIV